MRGSRARLLPVGAFGCRCAFAIEDRSRRHVRFARFAASAQQVVYRLVCALFGADKGGIGGDLGLDLRLGQPGRVALPGGVALAKFGIDPIAKVLPDGGIGPILHPPTDARVDPCDQTTQSGADHDTAADVAFIDAMPILRLRSSNGDRRQ